jgi:hypothetical protein
MNLWLANQSIINVLKPNYQKIVKFSYLCSYCYRSEQVSSICDHGTVSYCPCFSTTKFAKPARKHVWQLLQTQMRHRYLKLKLLNLESLQGIRLVKWPFSFKFPTWICDWTTNQRAELWIWLCDWLARPNSWRKFEAYSSHHKHDTLQGFLCCCCYFGYTATTVVPVAEYGYLAAQWSQDANSVQIWNWIANRFWGHPSYLFSLAVSSFASSISCSCQGVFVLHSTGSNQADISH